MLLFLPMLSSRTINLYLIIYIGFGTTTVDVGVIKHGYYNSTTEWKLLLNCKTCTLSRVFVDGAVCSSPPVPAHPRGIQIKIDPNRSLAAHGASSSGCPRRPMCSDLVGEAGGEAAGVPHPTRPVSGRWWPVPCQPGKFKF